MLISPLGKAPLINLQMKFLNWSFLCHSLWYITLSISYAEGALYSALLLVE